MLGRKEGIALFGGPGFVAQVEHKLRAYTWNVVHRYAVALVLDVREIGTDGRGRRARFSSRTGFVREPCAPFEIAGDVMHDEALFRVRGRFVDHEMPCLAFVVEEKSRATVAKDRARGTRRRHRRLAARPEAARCSPARAPTRRSGVRWRDRLGEHADDAAASAN